MKRVIDTSEALGTVEMPQGVCELCASANAVFDEEAGRLERDPETILLRSAERQETTSYH